MIISPEAFQYLSIQRGEVSNARHNFNKWQPEFEASVESTYGSVAAVLGGRDLHRVCGIGPGMGHMEVRLAADHPLADFTLVDGIDDPPEVMAHAHTFSNAAVSADFLKANGVTKFRHISTGEFVRAEQGCFDLVWSFAAWPFHIPPSDYIAAVKACMKAGSMIVCDVRRTKRGWLEEMVVAFGKPDVLAQAEKYVRLAFHV
jgi:hypothetical protein